MRRRVAIVSVSAALLLSLGAGSAFAQATGTPGTPNCYGERVSFGSSGDYGAYPGQGITPVDRAGFNGITVQEFHERVMASCAG